MLTKKTQAENNSVESEKNHSNISPVKYKLSVVRVCHGDGALRTIDAIFRSFHANGFLKSC